MLNPAFSRNISEQVKNSYILPEEIVNVIKQQNASFDTGPELRTQKVYEDELFLKLNSLGIKNFDWQNKDVLDVCAGTGFLSYHLLSRVKPKSLTLVDISKNEINEAKKLLEKFVVNLPLNFAVGDVTKTDFNDNSFDVVIGNSFFHHFYDLPAAIKEFKRILKPGGLFITLHEPTIASLAMESRNPLIILRYFLYGKSYIDRFYRYRGKGGVAPKQGADVWMFDGNELAELFLKNGFKNIKIDYWYFFRAKIVATFGLWLSEKKPKLNFLEIILIKIGIYSDFFLKRIAPRNLFGSVALKAQK
jgi:ubiquinone/menaquinone biosynthesis C-methylase UbiE